MPEWQVAEEDAGKPARAGRQGDRPFAWAQVTRLTAKYGGCGEVEATRYCRHRFASRFTADDSLPAAIGYRIENSAPGDEGEHWNWLLGIIAAT